MTPLVARAPRDNVKMAEHVAVQIRADIIARGWPVGEVLATEPELIDRYGVSRSVLREAMRIVEFLGVARMRQGPGGGLVVTAPDARAVTSAVLVYFAYARVSLEDLLGARRMIEEAAVELATLRASDAQLVWLREQLAGFVSHPAERDDHADFHGVIATLTANPAIVLFVTIIGRVTARYGRTGRPVASVGDPDRDFPGTKLGGHVAVDLLADIVRRGWSVGELDEARLGRRHDALAIQRKASLGGVGLASHALHATMAELTGNRAVWLFLLVLIRLTEVRSSAADTETAAALGEAHGAIVEAIAAHDPVRARRRMRRHLEAIAPTIR